MHKKSTVILRFLLDGNEVDFYGKEDGLSLKLSSFYSVSNKKNMEKVHLIFINGGATIVGKKPFIIE